MLRFHFDDLEMARNISVRVRTKKTQIALEKQGIRYTGNQSDCYVAKHVLGSFLRRKEVSPVHKKGKPRSTFRLFFSEGNQGPSKKKSQFSYTFFLTRKKKTLQPLFSIIITCMQFTSNYFRELMEYTQSNIPKYLSSWQLSGLQTSCREICCTAHTQQMARHTGLHLFPQ